MTQWKEIRLGDHLSFITSGSRGWSEYYASDGALFLRIQNVGYNELRLEDVAFVHPPDGAEARRTRVQPGDVLLSITADLGRTAVVPEGLGTAHINQHLAILRVEDIDPHYLAAFLSLGPGRLQLQRLDRVGVKSGLNFDDVRSLRILLPPLPEQRRIAAILDKADAIRRKRAEAIRLVDDFLKSAFLDMFGDPVTNPKVWPVVKLVTTFAKNPQIGTIVPAQQSGEQLVVRVGEIGDYNVAIERCKAVTLQGGELQRFLLEPGDFLLARAIGSEDHLGKASVLQDTDRPIVFDSHVMRLRFKSALLHPLFFLQWLKAKGGRARFMRRAGRTAVQFNINTEQIADIDIPLPPHTIQENFVYISLKTRTLLQRQEQISHNKQTLFNPLVQRAFRGAL